MFTQEDYRACIEPYISGDSHTCSYCDKLSPLILLEGKHTYITLAIGQITEGYLQVCTQKHRTAATGLYEDETAELILMKEVVKQAYKEVYGTPGIAFEHGKAGSCLWKEETYKNMNDLCHHCHIHFVPVEIDIRDAIKKVLPDELIAKDIQQLKKIREEILEAAPYLYFEDKGGIGYVYPVEDRPIPRQFLRTCIAEKLGNKELADWMRYPGVEYFSLGRERLKPVLEKEFLKITSLAA